MKRPEKTRIGDLAARVGVSAMTVSRALRGVEGVSEAKRAEILSLAKRLNYLPDMTARSMAVANSNLVGIALPTLFNDVFADVLSGMRGTFRSAGFATVIETTDYDRAREAEWVERLLSWRPAGIVLTGFDHDASVRRMLGGAGVPVVEIWDWRPDPIDLCVGIDHRAAGQELGAHVRDLGYRRPAFIGAPEGRDSRAEQRLVGLEQAFGGSVPVVRPSQSNAFEAGLAGGDDLLRRELPDVIFCLNDHIAFGALLACSAAGLTVPGDIGIVGFNGLPLAHVLPVPLTTMRTPRREMGVLAAQALLARRHGVAQGAGRCLTCTIVAGATTRRKG
ncbi:MAG: LacI family DNA-binding transcriptional regulator [Paracoccaceae bacterium]